MSFKLKFTEGEQLLSFIASRHEPRDLRIVYQDHLVVMGGSYRVLSPQANPCLYSSPQSCEVEVARNFFHSVDKEAEVWRSGFAQDHTGSLVKELGFSPKLTSSDSVLSHHELLCFPFRRMKDYKDKIV